MSAYQIDIQSTAGSHNPDEPEPRGMGVGMACSTVWCRVRKGGQSTPWTECIACPSMHKAHNLFNAALETYGDVDEDVAGAWLAVTGSPFPLLATSKEDSTE